MICIAAFFVLDSYNIFLERCYRVKYDWVVKYRSSSDFLFLDMSPKKRPEFKDNGEVELERFSLCKAARRSISLPTAFFYIVLLVMMFFVLSPRWEKVFLEKTINRMSSQVPESLSLMEWPEKSRQVMSLICLSDACTLSPHPQPVFRSLKWRWERR